MTTVLYLETEDSLLLLAVILNRLGCSTKYTICVQFEKCLLSYQENANFANFTCFAVIFGNTVHLLLALVVRITFSEVYLI